MVAFQEAGSGERPTQHLELELGSPVQESQSLCTPSITEKGRPSLQRAHYLSASRGVDGRGQEQGPLKHRVPHRGSFFVGRRGMLGLKDNFEQ